MCKWKLCFRVPKDSTTLDGSRFVCVCIPFLIPVEKLPIPPGDPFVMIPEFDREHVHHLQALVTIERLAEELPAAAARDVQRVVAAQMQTLRQRLGKGIELSQHDEAQS
jgi:hypothetical protein